MSVSEPLLQGGILVSVVGYMLYLDLELALLGLAFFLPQLVFVPLMQAAINRRAQARILTKRGLSGSVIDANTHNREPPSVRAATSSRGSIAAIDSRIARTINGKPMIADASAAPVQRNAKTMPNH